MCGGDDLTGNVVHSTAIDFPSRQNGVDVVPEGGEVIYGPFDTIELSGGYRVIATLEPDDSSDVPLERYTLWNDTLVTEIADWSYGFLRYDVMDWGESFLFLERTRGAGLPAMVTSFRKSTGAIIARGYYYDVDSVAGYLLYNPVEDEEEGICLVDIKSGKRELYSYPADMDAWGFLIEDEWYFGARIKSVSQQRLVIEYHSESDSVKTHEYSR